MKESEIWKDVAGFEGLYQVSDKGNVYSVGQKRVQGRKRGGRMLKPGHTSRGYLQVNLHKNGKRKTRTVHRLVAETFLPNPNGLSQVNHRDEDKDNNNVENLEWCTSEYNNSYGTRLERLNKKIRAVNAETGEVLTFNSLTEAGCEGYNTSAVSKACWGTYKARTGKLVGGDGRTYKGYKWSYKEEK